MKAKYSFLLFLTFLTGMSFAQSYRFSDNHDEFINDVKTIMANTKEPYCDTVATKFSGIWGNLSEGQKTQIVETSKLMMLKRLSVAGNFTDYYEMLYHAVSTKNMGGADLDTLLIDCNHIYENVARIQATKIMYNLLMFMKENTLFYHKIHKLRVEGGSFKFHLNKEVSTATAEENYYENLINQSEEQAEADELESEDTFEDLEEENDTWEDDWDSGDSWGDDWGGGWEEETTTEEKPKEESFESANAIEEEILEVGYTEPVFNIPGGPIIEFTDANFIIETIHDTTVLKNTSGKLSLITNEYFGEGGTFDWSEAGLPEVYVDLKKYKFNVRSPRIKAEGATLHYDSKINKPVEGIFEFVSVAHDTTITSRFPRFISYKSDIEIHDLGEHIQYVGGFSLRGQKVFSASVSENHATMEVIFHGKKKFKARAKNFTFGDSVVTSSLVSVVIYNDKDSIFHPAMRFKYDLSNHQLRLNKTRGGYKHTPFYDTYHNMEVHAEAIFWDVEDTVAHFTNIKGKTQIPAIFQSNNFYQEKDYIQLKGLYRFHPLQLTIFFAAKNRTNDFYLSDMLEYYKKNPQVTEKGLKSAMSSLLHRGYIEYNRMNGHVRLKDKAKHYVMSARNMKDYDNIRIESVNPPRYNATLNLNNNDLIIDGVDEVHLSDSLSVSFIPNNRRVIIKENKNFEFDGVIYTSNYVFNGRNFEFKYDSFYVDLVHIDSIQFSLTEKDSLTGRSLGRKVLDNKLVYTSGLLYIDKPDNKSSRKRNPQYPYFDAARGAYVFFNGKEVLNGVYSDKVFFYIPPFDQDSLSSDNEKAVNFQGEFESGPIFPKFNEKLVVRPDYSMGFEHHVPESGYQLYGGHGKFYGIVLLDNKGVRGVGRIEFLNTVLESSDFIFYEDSVVTNGTVAITKAGTNPDIAQTVTFPEFKIDNYKMKWLPEADSMYIWSAQENPFALYDNTATMKGVATISQSGMFGSGDLETRGSLTHSEKFHFEEKTYGAREAVFEIVTEDPKKPALRSNNVKLDFDLVEGFAYFSPEVEGDAANEFPYLQFKTSISNGVWDLEKKVITLAKEKEAPISSSYFYTTNPRMDSLSFMAERGEYLMEEQRLFVNGVPKINVNDVNIIPDSGFVSVRENAQIDSLINCELVMDTTNEYHYFHDGKVKIYGRKRFEGEGIYNYVNFGADTMEILFDNFSWVENILSKKETEMHTVCKGNIAASDSIFVAPNVLYTGKATLYSDQKTLGFEGAVTLGMTGILKIEHPLKYISNPSDTRLMIEVNNPQIKGGKLLHSGFFQSRNGKVYSKFLDTKKNAADHIIVESKGHLTADFDLHIYKIGPWDKIEEKQFQGPLTTYKEKQEEIKFEGPLDIVTIPEVNAKEVSFKTSGIITHSLKDSVIDLNTLLVAYFDVPSGVYDAAAERMKAVLELIGKESANSQSYELKVKIANLYGDQVANEWEKKAANPNFDLAHLHHTHHELQKGIVFSKVEMKWSNQYNAWYSVGKLGLSNINKTNIDAMVDGYVEIRATPMGNVVNIYFEANAENWFLFSYNDAGLILASSNNDFNETVASKQNINKNEPKGIYYFGQGNMMDKTMFINKFKAKYLGIGSADFQDDFEEEIMEEGFYEEETQEDIFEEELGEEEMMEEEPTEEIEEPAEEELMEEEPIEEEENLDQYEQPGEPYEEEEKSENSTPE